MAQFNNNNNQQGNNGNSRNANNTSYYSGLRITNYNEGNAITMGFSNGLMKIAISRPDENNRYQEEIAAFLTAKKAAIFVDQLSKLEAGEEGVFGTVLGMSEVQTAIGMVVKDDIKYLRIAKVDKNGIIQEQRTFAFSKNTDPGYRWSDFDNMKYTKTYNDEIDYTMFKNTLIDFSRNMSGAAGYGTLYLNRYQDNSMSARIAAICGKLGVNTGNGGNSNRSYGGGYFSGNDSNRGNATSQHRSYDEISSMIDDDDD